MLKLFSSLLFIFTLSAKANLDLKHSPIGESRIKFNKKDIKINIKQNTNTIVKAIIDETSFQWVRYDNILLVPQVRVKIKVEDSDSRLHINYKKQTISFQQSKKNSYSEVFYSLYEPNPIKIFSKDKVISEISLNFKNNKKKRVVIDYTCSRNSIKIEGLDKEHLSIGCQTRRIGQFGKERPLLEIKWISPELEIIGSEHLPYTAAFTSQRAINIHVRNIMTNKTKTIKIKAKIPKRLHRLFTAYGFGPYAFHTKITDKETNETSKKQVPMAPALFFYLNYKISEKTSIRGFDAAIFQESVFNNAGLYLGSDFGFSLDNKLYFTTLLGVQYLFFKFDEQNDIVSEPIFPQGIEFMYRHAFDIPNYIISGGIFLSTDQDIEYENVWIRWGRSYFWELNLISWSKDNFETKTWGLSVGFPFKGFL